MKKYSILQYNIGGYEVFREPNKSILENCEFIYVTDDKNITSEIVNVIHLDNVTKENSSYICKKIKYDLFDYCSTDICFYLDGSRFPLQSLDSIVERFDKSQCDIAWFMHGSRFNLLDELRFWPGRVSKDSIQKEISLMKSFNYDFDFKGLYTGTARIERKNNTTKQLNEKVLEINKMVGYSRIDQVLYSFVVNQFFNDKIKCMPCSMSLLTNSQYIAWYEHFTNRVMDKDLSHDRFLREAYVFNKLTKLEQF